MALTTHLPSRAEVKERVELIKGEYLVKNTTDIRIDVIFYD